MTARTKRDLPAFWSVSSHGQPFNDERLTDGASNHYKVAEPPRLGSPPPRPAGPATEALAAFKASLQNGFALFSGDAAMTPLSLAPGATKKLRTYVLFFVTILFFTIMCVVCWGTGSLMQAGQLLAA